MAIAEEAYHRFALGETNGPWLNRLTPGAAARLRDALAELPEPCWPTLASYTGVDLPAEMWQSANRADVERRLEARLRELMQRDGLEEAIALLHETPPSSPKSVLWRWQGRALALAGRPVEALASLERALATLAGPAEEAREDARLAMEMARKVGDAAALERLQAAEADAIVPPSAGFTRSSRRPEAVRSVGSSKPRWLDDDQFRWLVKAAMQSLPTPAAGSGGTSTRASGLYAEVTRLNEAGDGASGGRLRAIVDTYRAVVGSDVVRAHLEHAIATTERKS